MGKSKSVPFNHGSTHSTGGSDPIPGGGGGVSSVFQRTGAVVAQPNDYTPAQVGAVAISTLTTNEDMLIRRGGVPARLPVGAEGTVPKVVGGVIVWAALTAAVALDSARVGEVEYNIILLPYGLSATVEAGSFI